MNPWKYFEIAKQVATAKRDSNCSEDKRSFLIGAVGLRKDGCLVCSANGSAVIQNGDRRHYYPPAHAEHRVTKKLDNNSIVFVVRVGISGRDFKNAKPCDTCIRVMKSRGVLCVYYSISPNEYGVIWLKKRKK